jgi:hypothetical protein
MCWSNRQQQADAAARGMRRLHPSEVRPHQSALAQSLTYGPAHMDMEILSLDFIRGATGWPRVTTTLGLRFPAMAAGHMKSLCERSRLIFVKPACHERRHDRSQPEVEHPPER